MPGCRKRNQNGTDDLRGWKPSMATHSVATSINICRDPPSHSVNSLLSAESNTCLEMNMEMTRCSARLIGLVRQSAHIMALTRVCTHTQTQSKDCDKHTRMGRANTTWRSDTNRVLIKYWLDSTEGLDVPWLKDKDSKRNSKLASRVQRTAENRRL